jgi:hypothetical protein
LPATEVARRAGHGVANQCITDALVAKDTQPEPGGGEDGEGEMAS